VGTPDVEGVWMTPRSAGEALRFWRTKWCWLRLQTLMMACVALAVLVALAGSVLGCGVFAVLVMHWCRRHGVHETRLLTRALRRTCRPCRDAVETAEVIWQTLVTCRDEGVSVSLQGHVRWERTEDGVTVWLETTSRHLAQCFAQALYEALAPIKTPRFVLGEERLALHRRGKTLSLAKVGEVYRPVPGVFGRRAQAETYAALWALRGREHMTLCDGDLAPQRYAQAWCHVVGEVRELSVAEVRVMHPRPSSSPAALSWVRSCGHLARKAGAAAA